MDTPMKFQRVTRRISARPAGKDRFGSPIRAYDFTIDRDPEPFGEGKSRIFAENRSLRHPNGRFVFTPTVVITSSIEEVA